MSKQPMKKILRVGVIQGGRIVEEKLVRKREDVTIGQSAKNTFIVPSSHMSKSYKIFDARGDSYYLSFDDSMEGRVSLHNQVLDLKSVAKSGEVKKKGGRYLVELDDSSRGKVQMGDFTLLFQFVDKPPVLPRMQLPAEAKTKNIDWFFVNVLMTAFLLLGGGGVGLDVWWQLKGQYLQGQSVSKKNKLYETLKAEVMKDDEEDEEEEEEEEEETDEDAEEEEDSQPDPAPVKQAKKEPPKKAPEPEKRQTKLSKAQLQENVKKKTFIHTLAAVGGDGEGSLADTLSKGLSTNALDDAFNNLDGGVAGAVPGQSKNFVGEAAVTKTGQAGYQNVGAGELGGSKIKTKTRKTTNKVAAVKLKMKVRGKLGKMKGSGKLDGGSIKKVFKKRMKAIRYCYEKALKKNDSIKGKVKIKFTIGSAGRITDIKVQKNSTGDKSVGDCIMSKVRSWRFPKPEGGSVTVSYPFLLEKG
jgi:TonB family protein